MQHTILHSIGVSDVNLASRRPVVFIDRHLDVDSTVRGSSGRNEPKCTAHRFPESRARLARLALGRTLSLRQPLK